MFNKHIILTKNQLEEIKTKVKKIDEEIELLDTSNYFQNNRLLYLISELEFYETVLNNSIKAKRLKKFTIIK